MQDGLGLVTPLLPEVVLPGMCLVTTRCAFTRDATTGFAMLQLHSYGHMSN